jgi:hypothetical protein
MKLTSKQVYLSLLFLVSFAERTIFDLGPNVELITTAMILSTYYFGKKESVWLTLAIIIFSDLIIGNSSIFIFTWTGFLIPALFASGAIYKLSTNHSLLTTKKAFKTVPLIFTGFASNIFFYIWTNLGVWFIGNMYAKTFSGLMQSYINALPFLRYQILGTLIFVPVGFTLTEIAINITKNLKTRVRVPQLVN